MASDRPPAAHPGQLLDRQRLGPDLADRAHVACTVSRTLPGLRDHRLAFRVAHHLLLAHRAAAAEIRSEVKNARVGISLNLAPVHPASDSPEDLAAARRVDGYLNRWYLDALSGRGYPTDMLEWYGKLVDAKAADEMRSYLGDLDFLGINYYSRQVVRASAGEFLAARQVPVRDASYTTMGWEVYPRGLSEILTRVVRDYQPKAIYVTENGASFDDRPQNGGVPDRARGIMPPRGASFDDRPQNGDVPDPARTRYLAAHFGEAARAIEAGVPLEGYFIWSLMDNFEWSHGYTKRFGIVYVDYATQQRTDKESAHWYREFLANR